MKSEARAKKGETGEKSGDRGYSRLFLFFCFLLPQKVILLKQDEMTHSRLFGTLQFVSIAEYIFTQKATSRNTLLIN